MLNLVIENKDSGPLKDPATVCQLERIARYTSDLKEADRSIRVLCPTLATYMGGNHLAVHPSFRGEFATGSERVAILTKGGAK